MKRRHGLLLGAAAAGAGLAWPMGAVRASTQAAGAARVLRYAFPIAETSFDPPAGSDFYSASVVNGIFEAPLELEYLARPIRMRPNTAAAMPEVSADYRTFTFRIQPGIHFAEDPAFQGPDGRQVQRELVAEDYVYSLKRHADPRWNSTHLFRLENVDILGLMALRQKAMATRQPFDYDVEVEGLRTLDRYTFQIVLAEPAPRFLYEFSDASLTGAVAREVVEFYGDKVGEHPVGTGPFVLKSWRRSSRIVLARNPRYREVLYAEDAPADRPELVQQAAQLKGRRLPLVDEVHISIIEETQPRWLSFLGAEQDLSGVVPAEFAHLAFPHNQLAPFLAKRGVQMVQRPRSGVSVSYFAMEHPVVGGYEPHKVALRRAISLAVDIDTEIRLLHRGQAIPAQGPIPPGTWGYQPEFKTEMSSFSRARAMALLDMHGYVDRDGDGWREQPDGSPLLLEYSTQPSQASRQASELWRKNMHAIGIRIEFRTASWPQNLKSSRAGQLMMWGVGGIAAAPDGEQLLGMGYGPSKGEGNHARFDLPAFNTLYQQQQRLPDGPQRQAAMTAAAKLLVAYMPYKMHIHGVATHLAHPWVLGYDHNDFLLEFYKYVDIDTDARQRGPSGTR
jgi:ABC-type transport system substrate-binding protein